MTWLGPAAFASYRAMSACLNNSALGSRQPGTKDAIPTLIVRTPTGAREWGIAELLNAGTQAFQRSGMDTEVAAGSEAPSVRVGCRCLTVGASDGTTAVSSGSLRSVVDPSTADPQSHCSLKG